MTDVVQCDQCGKVEAKSKVIGLAARVKAMTPPQRLRLAAALMEERKSALALPIIRKVADELQLAIMLAERTE